MFKLIDNKFSITSKSSTVQKEITAGFTTFITMAYIIIVNPMMMSSAGMDYGASFVGTCLAAATACILMGLFANWPVGLAPGMGLNAFFTFTVVGEMGYTWEVALGAVFISGVIFFLISITRLRRWILESIPPNMRVAIGVGVGLFICFVGLKIGGIIIQNEATYLSIGDFKNSETILASFSFILIAILSVRKVPGSILIGIFVVTLISIIIGLVEFKGFLSAPPSIVPVFLKLDILGALDIAMISVIISFLFVNFFDTTGTLIGVANQSNLQKKNGEIENLNKALKADSSSSIFGTLFGCSPVTSYVESISGVEAGGRTGLTAIVVGILFLLAIFASPIVSIVPAYATAGALLFVSMLMFSGIKLIDWSDITDVIPALLTVISIPLTFSIADGIGIGFVSLLLIKLFTGRHNDLNLGIIFIGLLFILKFTFL